MGGEVANVHKETINITNTLFRKAHLLISKACIFAF